MAIPFELSTFNPLGLGFGTTTKEPIDFDKIARRNEGMFPSGGSQSGGSSGSAPIDPYAGMREANLAIDAEINRVRQQAADIDALYRSAREAANEGRAAALAETTSFINEIKATWQENKIDVDSVVGEYTDRLETAIGNMGAAAVRNAEFQTMQLSTLAATGKLGSNPFAVQRQMARSSGEVLAQVMGQIGTLQAHLADNRASLTMRGAEVNMQLFSQTMNTLAGLVGANAQIHMQYAGLVAGTYDSQARAQVQLAGLISNLVTMKVQGALDAAKIQHDMWRLRESFQHERSMTLLKMQHDAGMQERGFTHDMQKMLATFDFQKSMQSIGFMQSLEEMNRRAELDMDIKREELDLALGAIDRIKALADTGGARKPATGQVAAPSSVPAPGSITTSPQPFRGDPLGIRTNFDISGALTSLDNTRDFIVLN